MSFHLNLFFHESATSKSKHSVFRFLVASVRWLVRLLVRLLFYIPRKTFSLLRPVPENPPPRESDTPIEAAPPIPDAAMLKATTPTSLNLRDLPLKEIAISEVADAKSRC